jgi:DNA-directed RNA polymerase beta' subunit
MKLSLLNIEKYIRENNVKPVTSTNIFAIRQNSFDPNGLWSEEIFGTVGSPERKVKFGYIDIGVNIIHPAVYDMLLSSCKPFRDIITGTESYFFDKTKGIFRLPKNDKETEESYTGLAYFTKQFFNIDFEKSVKKDKADVGSFIKKYKNRIIINKYLVLPAGIRDMSLSRPAAKQFSSEINELYESLIQSVGMTTLSTGDIEMETMLASSIQKTCIKIYKWLQNQIKGKRGLLRGEMLKKTVDYTARIIPNSDPDIPIGTIGLPWHVVISLYEPHFFHHILHKDEKLADALMEYFGKELDINNMKEINRVLTNNIDKIPDNLKTKVILAAEEIVKDQILLCKRDPVVSRSSYYSANIKVLHSGRVAKVNGLTCESQTLDFDGDQIALYPVFTKQAREKAKKLNPALSKSAWYDPTSGEHHYPITLDAAATIFAATKF